MENGGEIVFEAPCVRSEATTGINNCVFAFEAFQVEFQSGKLRRNADLKSEFLREKKSCRVL